jgi:hypothetical protein
MEESPALSAREHMIAVVMLAAAIAIATVAYWPGTSGGMFFDDESSLGGLAELGSGGSTVEFVVSGAAGPLGRPLALASFVPNAAAWPHAPGVFLRTNVLIHILNLVLVVWLLYRLERARGHGEERAGIVATAAGAIWALMPILASSSLFIVQRMTTLSATFVLAGGIAYLYARGSRSRSPTGLLVRMTVALVAGALLGALVKENGALLLLFVLAIEATLLERPEQVPRRLWRAWFTVVLGLPLVVIAAFLASRIPYPDHEVIRRGFTGAQRLLTQAGILWEYLRLAFVPAVPWLGPFHDDHPLSTSLLAPATLAAVLAWVIVIVAAVALRRRAPLFAFAVAWYLLGHCLESTTFSLELYFEHRNYLPLIGPVYALIAACAALPKALRRLAAVAGGAYALVLAGVLLSVTSLWGNQPIAAEMWYIYSPKSIRAAELLARQMETTGNPDVALKIFREVRAHHPDAYYLDLQALLISCQIEPDADHAQMLGSLTANLERSSFSVSVLSMFPTAYQLGGSGKCPVLDKEAVYALADSLLNNPRYALPSVRSNLHMIMGQVALDAGDTARAVPHMRESTRLYLKPDRLKLAVRLMNGAGLPTVAEDILNEAEGRAPVHPMRAAAWRSVVDRLQREQARRLPTGAPDHVDILN